MNSKNAILVILTFALVIFLSSCIPPPGDVLEPTDPTNKTETPVIEPTVLGTGLSASYFNSNTGNRVLTRLDSIINYNWPIGSSPSSQVPTDYFSAVWIGELRIPESGTYTFSVTVDDGARLLINGNNILSSEAWKNQPATTYSGNLSLSAGKYPIRIEYYDSHSSASIQLNWTMPNGVTQVIPTDYLYPANSSESTMPQGVAQNITPTTPIEPAPTTPGTGLMASYFDSNSGSRLATRIDSNINFNWASSSPANGLPIDYYSAIWSGTLRAPISGTYTFSVTVDDGARLLINGNNVISSDAWRNQPATTYQGTLSLTAGTKYPIRVEFYEAFGAASIQLNWTMPNGTIQVIPVEYLYPSTSAVSTMPQGVAQNITPTTPTEPTNPNPIPPPSGTILLGPQSVPSTPASQGTRFASPSGTGTSCTLNSPCTASTAISGARAGDVVFLRGGTYPLSAQISLSNSGTSSNPIRIESYPGERAVLDGQFNVDTRLVIWGNYVHIKNINVTRMTLAGGVYTQGNYNLFDGINSYGNRANGFAVYSPYELFPYGEKGSHNIIRNCISHSNSDVGLVANGGDTDGVSISSGEGNVVMNCLIYGNSDDGIDSWRATNTLFGFLIVHSNGLGSGDGNGIKAGGASPSRGTIVMHSLSYNNRARGFDFNQGQDVKFYYVTSWNNAQGFDTWDTTRVEKSISVGGSLGVNTVTTQVDNSWQRSGTVNFISINPSSSDFLRPTSSGGFADIGAYAPSPYLNRTKAPFN